MKINVKLENCEGNCIAFVSTNLKRQILFLANKLQQNNWTIHYRDDFDIVIPESNIQVFDSLSKAIQQAQKYI